MRRAAAAAALALAVLAAPARAGAPVPAPAFAAEQLSAYAGDDWIVVHGDLGSQSYSTLDQVNAGNVAGLRLAWSTHLGGRCTAANASCGAEANALVYRGTMYLETGAADVVALDAASGRHVWEYHPTFDQGFVQESGVSRGVALGEGKLFVPRSDGRLVALDQLLGGVVWATPLGDWRQGFHLTAAPVYYDGMVIVGMSGGDRGTSDYMSAVDASSGRLLWRWNAIPRPGQTGYRTWGDRRAFLHGGGAIWNSVSIDPTLDLVYFGTGNPVPWNTRPRGRELWTDSVVALHAHTGRLAWGFQTVHHDVWDDDVPASPVLFDAPYRRYRIAGSGRWVDEPANGFHGSHAAGVRATYSGAAVTRPAIAQTTKTGFLYVLDRRTGRPLLPTPELRVDQHGGTGLNLSPTQPIPLGDSFTGQCVLPSQWTSPGLDGAPVEHGCTFTPVGFDHFVAVPHSEGEWMPSAYDPPSHRLYVCTVDNRSWAMRAVPAASQAALLHPGTSYSGILLSQGTRDGITGGFTAMNVLTGRIAWRDTWPDFCYSGATATAGGLVFTGHNDGRIEAIDSATGRSLWRSPPAEAAANAPVVTYTAGGKQYVSVFAGGNPHENTPRGDLVVAYALP